MYVNRTWQCSKQDRLSQRALLALIFDEQANEIQTIEITNYKGLPNGGTFKLSVSNQITDDIYYSQNYIETLAHINFALSKITPVKVSSVGPTRFIVEFQNATYVPKMTLVENNLTLNGLPAGQMTVTMKQIGGMSSSPYEILKNLNLNEWSIISFDAKTRVACVAIQKQNTWVVSVNGNKLKNPFYLSIYVPLND